MEQILLSGPPEVGNVGNGSNAFDKGIVPSNHHERVIVVIASPAGSEGHFDFADVRRPNSIARCIGCPL